MVISCVGFSQSNFIIKYDYKADNYELFREREVFKKQSKDTSKYVKVNTSKFKEGDIVKVVVFNYNPLKYKVTIEQKQIKYKPLMEPQVLGTILNVFNQKQTALNFLGPDGVNIDQLFRDGEEVEFHFSEDFKKEQEYSKLLKDFYYHYGSLKENLVMYSELIKNEMMGESLSKTEIIKQLETIRSDFKKISVYDVIAEGKKAQSLFLEARVYSSTDDFLTMNKKIKPEDREKLLEDFKNFTNSNENIVKILNELEALQSNPKIRVDDDKLLNLLNTLETLNYETEKTFVIKTNSGRNLRSTDPEGVLTDLNFEVVVYDLQKLRDLSTEEEEFTQYVKYPNDALFIGLDGKITTKPCLTCQSLLYAEGTVRGKEIPSIDDVINNNCSSCIGKWIFYNEEGEISRIKSEPKTTILSGKDQNAYSTIKIDNPEEFETAVKVKKSLQMPVAGAVAMNWTTGVFGVSPFGGRRSFEEKYENDSVQVIGTKLSPFALSLGTLMSLDFLSNRRIIPSINVGVAVDVLKTTNLNYLAGFSIRPKALTMLSFSGGLSYSLTSVLNDNITVNTNYSLSEYQNLKNSQDFKKEAYRFGYFFGMCVSF